MQNPKLTDEQKYILFNRGTEPPFSGKYLKHDEKGLYTCANCGKELFTSNSKYQSGQPGLEGWPSFAEAIDNDAIKLEEDYSFGMHRVEAVCTNCGVHLGHVFDDDTSPSGQHFCINSLAIDFKKDTKDDHKV
jgi:peptide-methionine (R)-S-oxide reductase